VRAAAERSASFAERGVSSACGFQPVRGVLAGVQFWWLARSGPRWWRRLERQRFWRQPRARRSV